LAKSTGIFKENASGDITDDQMMNLKRNLLGVASTFWMQVKLLTEGCVPFQEAGSIGFDMFAAVDGFIDPLQRSKPIPLGFEAAFTPGWVGLLLDRSGMGNKGITHFAGVIDPNYRQEWRAILYNSTIEPFHYKKGDKLIQCVFVMAGINAVEVVNSLPPTNRVGGFGSTDKLAKLLISIGYAEIVPGLYKYTPDQQKELQAWAEEYSSNRKPVPAFVT
jgi:deoxyuridine 5'-triphosphate nucleotidohydrolase